MELELKHIAPYLPYGLKALVLDLRFGIGDLFLDKITGIYEDLVTFNDSPDWYFDSDENDTEIKLALRPISDLTKEIEHNGEKFIPLRKLEELFPCVEFYNDDELSYLFSDTDCRGEFFHSIELNLTLEISSKLFEWHFDVFNLLENGLAIDINTI